MLQHHHGDGVATLTLDRPERGNALAADLVEALILQVDLACRDTAVHTLVLRARGTHFCTGLDLSDLATVSDGDLLLRLVRIETLLSALWHAPMRTVAVAHGRVWGAGADLFAVCEQRIAHADASFRFPGAQFGIVLGTRRLAERIGIDAARRLVTEGGELDAMQAHAAGLASALVSTTAAEPSLPELRVSADTARALRAATRADRRDADLAALVRSAAEPGLKLRIAAYRERLRAATGARLQSLTSAQANPIDSSVASAGGSST
jgi:enoyl-CoA hydratase/carnithine racemase